MGVMVVERGWDVKCFEAVDCRLEAVGSDVVFVEVGGGITEGRSMYNLPISTAATDLASVGATIDG